MLISGLLLGGALLVALVNGANDNFKGVATLYGSGELSYRKALLFGTIATAFGGIASLFLGTALVQAFSAKGLIPEALLSEPFLASVAGGAALTVLLATRLGFPVSTTHALVGGLTGAGWVGAGSSLNLEALGRAFALPLVAGPILATALALIALRFIRFRGTESKSAASSPGRSQKLAARSTSVRWGHLISSGLVSFARGLNDTPKILGLIVGTSLLSPAVGALLITGVMAFGGLLFARRVGETLGRKITPMLPQQGVLANCSTALLVLGATRLGVPVSTTHVSTGGIFGIGIHSGSLRARPVWEILGAWLTTVPLAALLAGGILWQLR